MINVNLNDNGLHTYRPRTNGVGQLASKLTTADTTTTLASISMMCLAS